MSTVHITHREQLARRWVRTYLCLVPIFFATHACLLLKYWSLPSRKGSFWIWLGADVGVFAVMIFARCLAEYHLYQLQKA